MRKKAALHNLGCKVNAYELEAMRQQLEEAGYEIVPFAPGADVYIINTCTVTNIADKKSRQMLHRAKKMNPGAVVAAVGCYVQTSGEKLEKDPAIDLLIGSSGKRDLVRLLEQCFAAAGGSPAGDLPLSGAADAGGKEEPAENGTGKILHREDLTHSREYEPLRIDRSEGHTRAFLKIQDGCDQFCSYCIIPFARGRVRSRRREDILEEIRQVAASGCREIVITGIHLCSYGTDLARAEDPSADPAVRAREALLSLLAEAAEIPGIARIRLGSLEPGFMTEETVRRLAEIPKLCPHFHLSLQSGCDATLARMRRRYRAEDYRRAAGYLRECFADPALTTDIIVGFPGETEEEFAESFRFAEEMHFFETHIFPYSRREGTTAAGLPGQIAEAVKRERSDALLKLDAARRAEYLERAVGGTAEVLFEERAKLNGKEYWAGHTARYREVLLESAEDLGGRIREVSFAGVAGGRYLIGNRKDGRLGSS